MNNKIDNSCQKPFDLCSIWIYHLFVFLPIFWSQRIFQKIKGQSRKKNAYLEGKLEAAITVPEKKARQKALKELKTACKAECIQQCRSAG